MKAMIPDEWMRMPQPESLAFHLNLDVPVGLRAWTVRPLQSTVSGNQQGLGIVHRCPCKVPMSRKRGPPAPSAKGARSVSTRYPALVGWVDLAHALHNPVVFDVETGNDSPWR